MSHFSHYSFEMETILKGIIWILGVRIIPVTPIYSKSHYLATDPPFDGCIIISSDWPTQSLSWLEASSGMRERESATLYNKCVGSYYRVCLCSNNLNIRKSQIRIEARINTQKRAVKDNHPSEETTEIMWNYFGMPEKRSCSIKFRVT